MEERDCLPSKYVAHSPSSVIRHLPKANKHSLVPEKYHISLCNFLYAPDWRYEGLVEISCQVRNAVQVVQVNSKNLDIQSVKVRDGNGGTCPDTPVTIRTNRFSSHPCKCLRHLLRPRAGEGDHHIVQYRTS